MTCQNATKNPVVPTEDTAKQNYEMACSIPYTRTKAHSFLVSETTTAVDARCSGSLSFYRFCATVRCRYDKHRNQHFRPLDKVVRCMEPRCTAWMHERCYHELVKSYDGGQPNCYSDAHNYSEWAYRSWDAEQLCGVAYPTKAMLNLWKQRGIDPYAGMYYD
ncbi:hypothetical protein BJ508DRAFT_313115 [Ascobolus immersus RN42]|uniref:Uncharacterized protein n=1 Tax=Ascobolus immersus RN42 TaxID=1160509 RepID=A0A3N4HMS7_ASCIM|nr:hypothetical protein BJ508DRAFT_313115 [Ascobolus immersus RN42]